MRAISLKEKSVVLGLFFLCFPWLIYGTEYPLLLVTEVDHCPKLACDFTRHYLPQAQHALQGDGLLNSGWFYPPLFHKYSPTAPTRFFPQSCLGFYAGFVLYIKT